jgi:hypothetical protein
MRLTDIANLAVDRIIARLCRRAAGWLLVIIFALAAIYQATAAVSVAIELEFGIVEAHLMIAAFYGLAAASTVIVLWMTSRRPRLTYDRMSVAHVQPELQLAMIVEAMLLGYSLSRRK